MKLEHEELHAELVKATKAGGKIGEVAKAVARILHSHFVKEEEYVLPPLGLLPPLAEGKATPEWKAFYLRLKDQKQNYLRCSKSTKLSLQRSRIFLK